MPRLLVTHGRAQAFEIPAQLQRDWGDALLFGLRSAHLPTDSIDVEFAFYGDIWRPDRRDDDERGGDDERSAVDSALQAPASDLQAAFANELVPVDEDGERLPWDTLVSIVRALDQRFGVGEILLTRFMADLNEYFEREDIREQTWDRLREALRAQPEPVILLGHSMGSIVAYDLLATDGAESLNVEALVTFGSPLGMGSLRRRLLQRHPGTPFPAGLGAWSNIYNREDFATAVPELAPLFPATDGREIHDVESLGKGPGVLDPGRGHDPVVYLSSMGLAEELASLLGAGAGPEEPDAAAAPDAPAPMPDAAAPEPSDRPPTRGGIFPPSGNGHHAEPPDAAPPPPPPPMAPPPPPASAPPPPAGGLPRDEPTSAPPPDDGERGDESSPPPTAAEPPGAPAPEAGTRTVERQASADFPPIVAPGAVHDLLFTISGVQVHARSTGVSITAPIDQQEIDMRVGVYAADFDVAAHDDPSRTWTTVTVDLDDPSKRAEGRFRLTAHQLTEKKETPIYLTFYRGNLPVGQLTLVTTIDPVHDVRKASISVPFGGAPDPDYVLVVTDRSDGLKGAGPFDISVSKEGEFLNRPLGSFPVAVNAWEYASQRLDGFRRVKDEPDSAERIRAAEMLGVELWNDLPEDFKRFYWEELHDSAGSSIAIYSQEPYIPWELIKPQRGPGDADGFLGAVFNIARWKQATKFPDPLSVSDFSVIAPVYAPDSGNRPLPGAQAEADQLTARFGARKIEGDRKTVRALLETGQGVQIVHFAGHGDFDPQNSAAMTLIRLSDASLVPADLTQATLGHTSRPFVFLNACEVGEQGWALTRIGGWAEAFTDVGFSGFVGPYWAVNDKVALKASLLFYRSLAAGLTVAEAVRQIRLRFYSDEEHAGHPSWLAYTLHCQPNIRIQLTEVAPPTEVAGAAGGPR